MSFDASDPRATLAVAQRPATAAGPFAKAHYHRFYARDADDVDGGTRTWYARGQAAVIAYTEAAPGAELARRGQVDEYAVLLPRGGAEIEAAGARVAVDGFSVAFVPPGDSIVRSAEGGPLVRIFTTRSADLVEACGEWEDDPRVPPLEPWPAPDADRVRTYSLDVPPEDGRFGRIFRCSTLMVNYLEPSDGPRDPTKLSPHHHDDFEQFSLALEGEFVHHLRWPWTSNRLDWREDEHVVCGGPSVAVIPPPAVHTTEATGSGRNALVDIFCPPRRDFSEKPGWVLNAADYPPPASGVA
jgi:hypothetical protein